MQGRITSAWLSFAVGRHRAVGACAGVERQGDGTSTGAKRETPQKQNCFFEVGMVGVKSDGIHDSLQS